MASPSALLRRGSSEVCEHAGRVRQGVVIAPAISGGHEVRPEGRPFVAALDQAVARFDIAVEGVDEGGHAIEVGLVVVVLVRSDDARVVDVVERGEESDVEVGKAQRCRVLRGQAHRAAEDGVVGPDAVLQEQREETDGEGQVETGFLAGEAGIEGADVTLEEQRLRVEVELVVELLIAAAAAELEAGEFIVVLLKRREEGVDAFGAGDLEVDVEVQPGRDLGDVLAVVVVVGDRRPPVAVDGEAREQRIRSPRRVLLSSYVPEVYCWRPSSTGGRGGSTALLAPYDVDVSVGVVLGFVLRIGSERSGTHFLLCRPRCLRLLAADSAVLSAVFFQASFGLRVHVLLISLLIGFDFGGNDLGGAGPRWDRLAFLTGLAAAFACRRFRSRAGHRKVTTGYQRECGGHCSGTVPALDKSYGRSTSMALTCGVGWGPAAVPLRVPNAKPSASWC